MEPNRISCGAVYGSLNLSSFFVPDIRYLLSAARDYAPALAAMSRRTPALVQCGSRDRNKTFVHELGYKTLNVGSQCGLIYLVLTQKPLDNQVHLPMFG